jgi:hypothetical protein
MIGLIVASLAAIAADNPPPVQPPPSGTWVVDYRTDMCLATRTFGPATAPVTLAFKPAMQMDGAGATLYVVTPNKGSNAPRDEAVIVTVLPSGEQKKVNAFSAVIASGQPAYNISLDGDFMAAMALGKAVTITVGKSSFPIATGKIQPVLTALAACNADLFRSWGVVDLKADADLPKSVNPGQWFTNDAWPSEVEIFAKVVLLLTVAPNGKVSACKAVVSSKNTKIYAAACNIAKNRGRYVAITGNVDRYSIISVSWEKKSI